MDPQTEGSTIWRDPAAPWLVGCGLAIVFLPVLMDLADHMWSHPWARTALVFGWLGVVAVRLDRSGTSSESKRMIWASVVLGVVLYLLAVGGDVMRLGRLALLICLIGILCGAGWARPRAAVIFLWAVPLPSLLVRLFSPWPETIFGRLAAAVVPGVGFEGVADATSLVAGDAHLSLGVADGGLALAFGLAGLAWFQAVENGVRAWKRIGWVVAAGLAMVPIQIALIVSASALLAAGVAPSRASWVLDESGWILVLVLGLALSLWALRSDRNRRVQGARL